MSARVDVAEKMRNEKFSIFSLAASESSLASIRTCARGPVSRSIWPSTFDGVYVLRCGHPDRHRRLTFAVAGDYANVSACERSQSDRLTHDCPAARVRAARS